MRKHATLLLLVFLLPACTFDISMDKGQNERVDIVLTKSGEEIVVASNRFAWEFLSDLAREDAGNVFYSPLSLQIALSMAEAGANGQTKTQIDDALAYGALPEGEVESHYSILLPALLGADKKTTMHIANSLWLNPSVSCRSQYKNTLKNSFKADLNSLPTSENAATKAINNWVKKNTSGMIPKIADNVDASAAVILLNALYFESEWASKFDTRDTKKDVFNGSKGKVNTEFMHKHFDKKYHTIEQEFQATSLSYGNGAFSLVILLPHVSSSVENALASLSDNVWRNICNPVMPIEMYFSMPKFTTEYSVDKEKLMPLLKNRGMIDAFNLLTADFTGITETKMAITDIIHKAKIVVDESGSKAAAATDVALGWGSAGIISTPKPCEFIVNRPFAYFITENSTGAILFAGVQREF